MRLRYAPIPIDLRPMVRDGHPVMEDRRLMVIVPRPMVPGRRPMGLPWDRPQMVELGNNPQVFLSCQKLSPTNRG